jgi:acetyl esterase/lipase
LALAPHVGAETKSASSPGTVHIPAFDLPVSSFLSSEAKTIMQRPRESDTAPCPPLIDAADLSVATVKVTRTCLVEKSKARIEQMQAQFAVNIEPRKIAGVPTEIFTPKGGIAPLNERRILINLHGGGFVVGSPSDESIAVAGRGRIKVVGVDYRMAPRTNSRRPARM